MKQIDFFYEVLVMKAVQVKKPGGAEVLELVNLPKPVLKKGWSLVKVLGFGVNRSEVFTRQGYSPSVVFPRVLGIECVGIIEESSDESYFKKGQLIISIMGEMGRDYDGSYAEYVLIPNQSIYPIKTSLSLEKLVSLPESYYTAFGSMKQLQIKENDRILVRSGASGLGIAFLKLVKALDISVEITASVRHERKVNQLKEAGFDKVILEKNCQLETQETYDKLLDLVGPKVIDDNLKHLSENGIICIVGLLGGQWDLENFDPIMSLKNRTYLTAFYLGMVTKAELLEMLTFIENQKVDIPKPKIYSLDQIQEAHQFIEGTDAFGKAIVLLEDNRG